MEEVGLRIYKVISCTNMPMQIVHLDTLMDVLSKWGCTWMWEDMHLTEDDGWLATTIQENKLVAITNGLYMCVLYPNMNSCAFILGCTQGCGHLTGAFS